MYSKEGVTQGDPLSMFMYAIGTLPLIRSLHDPGRWTQLWYADDASAGGTLSELRSWFDHRLYIPYPGLRTVHISKDFCKPSTLVLLTPFLCDVGTGWHLVKKGGLE